MKIGLRVAFLISGLALIPLVAPTVIVMLTSFSAGTIITFPPQGFSLEWYRQMIFNPDVRESFANSLHIAFLSVLINVLCGVPAALALPRLGRHASAVFTILLALGLSSPTIVSAFAYFNIYSRLGLVGNLSGVGLAVAVTCFPFMLWAVLSAIEDEDPELISASSTMGAEPVEQFLFVRLPLIAPGIVTGSLIVFVLSITDFVVSQVLTNVDSQTLPVYIYGGLRGAISPSLGAAAVLFIAIAALIFVMVLRIGKVERFLTIK